MGIDVLFIHPGNQKRVYQNLSADLTAIATPIWATLLAEHTRQKGYDPKIYDVNVEGWDNNVPQEIMDEYKPTLIIIMVYGHHPSASTQTMPAARNIISDIKSFNKNIPIALGGIHPSALPERTLKEENVDFVMQGECAYTIVQLLDYFHGKISISKVSGLWYKKDTTIKFTSQPQVIQNLDEQLGNYAWDLLPNLNNYRAHNWHCFQDFKQSNTGNYNDIRSPYVAIYSSLGCPYSCSYCCINTIFNKPSIRYWSLEKVVSWIDHLVNTYKIKNIMFADELFILSPKRIETFCDMIIERGYELNIWAYARVDTIRFNLLKKLKRAGVNWLCLGIESGNAMVRDNVNKTIKNNIKDVVQMIQANNIYVLGNYMFGLPDDDLSTMEQTLELALDLNCEFANFYSVMAYPGSKLYDTMKSNPQDLPETWNGYSQHSYDTQPLKTNSLSPAQVLQFRDEAFFRYFTNQKYLQFVDQRFGEKVVNHIKDITKIKLKRKIVNAN